MKTTLVWLVACTLLFAASTANSQATGTCTAGTEYCEAVNTVTTTTSTAANTNTNTNTNNNTNTNTTTATNTNNNTNVNTNT